MKSQYHTPHNKIGLPKEKTKPLNKIGLLKEDDDKRYKENEALEENEKGGKKTVKLPSDIYDTTKDLSKQFIAEAEYDISTFTTHMKDEGLDLAPIINLKQVL